MPDFFDRLLGRGPSEMNADAFWKLIARHRPKPYDPDAHAERLTAALDKLPTEQVVAFDRIFREHVAQAYRWDLWGAAYVMNGGCSDDGFEYFRYWLVGQGREVYEGALANPESLAKLPQLEEGEAEAESLGYVGMQILEGRGEPVPQVPQPAKPVGEPWDEDEVFDLFPRLAEKYG
jgi:hypothetical protein